MYYIIWGSSFKFYCAFLSLPFLETSCFLSHVYINKRPAHLGYYGNLGWCSCTFTRPQINYWLWNPVTDLVGEKEYRMKNYIFDSEWHTFFTSQLKKWFCGVPQGSCFGPLSFSLFIQKTNHVVENADVVKVHMVMAWFCALPSSFVELE